MTALKYLQAYPAALRTATVTLAALCLAALCLAAPFSFPLDHRTHLMSVESDSSSPAGMEQHRTRSERQVPITTSCRAREEREPACAPPPPPVPVPPPHERASSAIPPNSLLLQMSIHPSNASRPPPPVDSFSSPALGFRNHGQCFSRKSRSWPTNRTCALTPDNPQPQQPAGFRLKKAPGQAVPQLDSLGAA